MSLRTYILDEKGKPVPCDWETWATWFGTAQRIIAQTKMGRVMVSTIFLGLDHNWSETGPPILWETMVLGGAEQDGERCAGTKEQAEAMHMKWVKKVFGSKLAGKEPGRTKPQIAEKEAVKIPRVYRGILASGIISAK